MEVPVSKLRATLKDCIETARGGEDVVITDRGVPVARLSGIESADLITRLHRDGLVTGPDGDRPEAEVGPRDEAHRGQTPLGGIARRLRR